MDQDRWEVVDPYVIGGGHAVACSGRGAVDQASYLHGAGLAHDKGAWRLAGNHFETCGCRPSQLCCLSPHNRRAGGTAIVREGSSVTRRAT